MTPEADERARRDAERIAASRARGRDDRPPRRPADDLDADAHADADADVDGDARVDVEPGADAAPGRDGATGSGSAGSVDLDAVARSSDHTETTTFLLDSIRDLDAERAAGDIGEDDYRNLRDDYTRRAARSLRAEARGRKTPVSAPVRRSPGQWAAIILGIVGFAVLLGVLVAQAAGERRAGEGITGEIDESPTQAAAGCINMTVAWQQDGGIPTDAIECYGEVLDEDPDNAVALTYLAWTNHLLAQQVGPALEVDELARLLAEVDTGLEQALEVDPGYADALAFRVVVAVSREEWTEAEARLEAFDAIDAPTDIASLVDGVRDSIDEGLTGTTTTTTTTTTATEPG